MDALRRRFSFGFSPLLSLHLAFLPPFSSVSLPHAFFSAYGSSSSSSNNKLPQKINNRIGSPSKKQQLPLLQLLPLKKNKSRKMNKTNKMSPAPKGQSNPLD